MVFHRGNSNTRGVWQRKLQHPWCFRGETAETYVCWRSVPSVFGKESYEITEAMFEVTASRSLLNRHRTVLLT
jgi:hypothetical protein